LRKFNAKTRTGVGVEGWGLGVHWRRAPEVVWAGQNKILQARRDKIFVPGPRRRPVPIDWTPKPHTSQPKHAPCVATSIAETFAETIAETISKSL